MSKYFMWILWPAFIAAGIGVGILFTLIDPEAIVMHGTPLNLSRIAVYTLGFLFLWALCAASSALSCFLQSALAERRG